MNPLWLMAGAQLGGSALNYLNQESANERNVELTQQTNAMNSSIAQENRDFQYKMWKEQTAYNAPGAQMSRLQEAGLNPNLVYGQIAESKMSSPPSTPIAHMESASVEAPQLNVVNPIAEYMQVKNLQAMNVLRNTEIVKAKSEAISSQARAAYDVYETDSLMRRGLLKSDNSVVKAATGMWDYLKTLWHQQGSGELPGPARPLETRASKAH